MKLTEAELKLIQGWLSEFMRPNIWDGERWLLTSKEEALLLKLGMDLS